MRGNHKFFQMFFGIYFYWPDPAQSFWAGLMKSNVILPTMYLIKSTNVDPTNVM
jgi:hypothetical protein